MLSGRGFGTSVQGTGVGNVTVVPDGLSSCSARSQEDRPEGGGTETLVGTGRPSRAISVRSQRGSS